MTPQIKARLYKWGLGISLVLTCLVFVAVLAFICISMLVGHISSGF